MKKVIKLLIFTMCFSAASVSGTELITNKPLLTLDGAKLIAEHAAKKSWILTILRTDGRCAAR